MPTILAVDDSATMRKALEITFVGTEFDLVTCATPDEALEKVKSDQPALAIVDVSLPPSDGYELCSNIKSAAPALPVLMLASKQNPFDGDKGASADDHFIKPFDTQKLADKVREMVAAGPAVKPAAAAAEPAAAGPPRAEAPAAAAPAAPTPAASPPKPSPPAARPTPSLKETKPLGFAPSKPSVPKPTAPVAKPARPSAPRPAVGAGGATPSPPAAAKPAEKRGTVASWPAPAPKGAAAPAATAPKPPALGADVAAAATGADLQAKLEGLGLSSDQVSGVLALSREVIEQVVWEVVPTLAETLIKEEIARLTK